MKYHWKDTEHYIKIYNDNPKYGSDRRQFVSYLVELIDRYKLSSFFYFGCGLNYVVIKECFEKRPTVKYFGYDPAITDVQCNSILHNYIPKGYKTDMLISSDCLEHIHEDELPQVWEIFNTLQPKVMYHWISTRTAGQLLSDSSNAHKTVKADSWWAEAFNKNLVDYTTTNLTNDKNKQNNSAVFLSLKT